MHGLFPTLEQWDQLNHKTLSHRFKSSRQWDELDRAVRAFSVDQANESLFQQLKSATEAFVALKTKADGLFHTTRDSNGVISALRAFVADHAPTMSTAEHTAIREVILKNKQALFRGLVGAEIRYKPKEKSRWRMRSRRTLKSFETASWRCLLLRERLNRHRNRAVGSPHSRVRQAFRMAL